ncbi:unnamed protein product [Rhizophagus irregularis]|nr:unnamed protein product [Rhizophagus irregularis]
MVLVLTLYLLPIVMMPRHMIGPRAISWSCFSHIVLEITSRMVLIQTYLISAYDELKVGKIVFSEKKENAYYKEIEYRAWKSLLGSWKDTTVQIGWSLEPDRHVAC